MTDGFGEPLTSIAMPRCQVAPASVDCRTTIVPPSLMKVNTEPASAALTASVSLMSTPVAVAGPPLAVWASTLIVPLLVIVEVFWPDPIEMPVALADAQGACAARSMSHDVQRARVEDRARKVDDRRAGLRRDADAKRVGGGRARRRREGTHVHLTAVGDVVFEREAACGRESRAALDVVADRIGEGRSGRASRRPPPLQRRTCRHCRTPRDRRRRPD